MTSTAPNSSERFGSNTLVRSNNVGPDYFHVLGVPILEGRDISEVDTTTSLPVVVVNETFVKKFLANTNPLGHKFRDNRTIVGVAKDSKYRAVDERPLPMAYYPSFQNLSAGATMHVEVRIQGEPLNLLPTLRRAVHEHRLRCSAGEAHDPTGSVRGVLSVTVQAVRLGNSVAARR